MWQWQQGVVPYSTTVSLLKYLVPSPQKSDWHLKNENLLLRYRYDSSDLHTIFQIIVSINVQ